jgi:6-pyruvoyltetrahydropterin/6-carboxytetrahydropterin synthase
VSETCLIHKAFTLECAHRLPHVPPGHKCARLHGHSYRIELRLRAPLREPEGWVRDFADVTAAFASVRERLDHRCLNDVPGLENPTSEILAVWIYRALKPALPELVAVAVGETPTSGAVYAPGET